MKLFADTHEGKGSLLHGVYDEFEFLKKNMNACEQCSLYKTRTHVVVGSGDISAQIMFIGEAPGKNEDEAGEPFVGAAGKRLDELLSDAGINRSEVYIANILKCRPPKNRNPKAEEIQKCTPFLRQQLQIIQPLYVVTLGNFATQYMLDTKVGISELRGKFYKKDVITIFPIFHPAAAIYDRSKMPLIKQDFATLAHMLHT